ncbi:MAG: ACT domain-containing protein, partial [Nitriliruptorales bacterium]|nr:ACT domain-containing protein [Nitriliruptorales bacterium]
YGADRPGIVHAVASALAQRSINITDLTTRVLEGESPVYAMLLEISLHPGTDPEELAADLRRAGAGGVEVSIHPLDVATF